MAADNIPHDSVVELRDGRVIRIHHEPLPDQAWVATHEDVTEQRRSEDELRRRNLQFDAAIANMSQGLCMFNADEEMIVCNLNYCTMFGLSPDFIKPGISLYQILQHSVDIDVASESADELYRRDHCGKAAHDLLRNSRRRQNHRYLASPDGRWRLGFHL